MTDHRAPRSCRLRISSSVAYSASLQLSVRFVDCCFSFVPGRLSTHQSSHLTALRISGLGRIMRFANYCLNDDYTKLSVRNVGGRSEGIASNTIQFRDGTGAWEY